MARRLMLGADWVFFEPFFRDLRARNGRQGPMIAEGRGQINFLPWTLPGLLEAILQALNEGAAELYQSPDRLQMIDNTVGLGARACGQRKGMKSCIK